ncbi:unnamed protein product, partial [Chrysoparadoxa australica]
WLLPFGGDEGAYPNWVLLLLETFYATKLPKALVQADPSLSEEEKAKVRAGGYNTRVNKTLKEVAKVAGFPQDHLRTLSGNKVLTCAKMWREIVKELSHYDGDLPSILAAEVKNAMGAQGKSPKMKAQKKTPDKAEVKTPAAGHAEKKALAAGHAEAKASVTEKQAPDKAEAKVSLGGHAEKKASAVRHAEKNASAVRHTEKKASAVRHAEKKASAAGHAEAKASVGGHAEKKASAAGHAEAKAPVPQPDKAEAKTPEARHAAAGQPVARLAEEKAPVARQAAVKAPLRLIDGNATESEEEEDEDEEEVQEVRPAKRKRLTLEDVPVWMETNASKKLRKMINEVDDNILQLEKKREGLMREYSKQMQ